MVIHWYFIEAPTSRCTHTIRLDPKMEYWGEGGGPALGKGDTNTTPLLALSQYIPMGKIQTLKIF